MSEASQPPPNQNDRAPRLGSRAFVCPHCRAFAQQRWFTLNAAREDEPPEGPSLADVEGAIANCRALEKRGEEPPVPVSRLEAYRAALQEGLPILTHSSAGYYVYWLLENAHMSTCFVCEKPALWIGGRVRFPLTNAEVPEPNEDLPADIRRDYVEAGEVVLASPRSAAALLRLAIQKLCSHVLQKDGSINEMIADLVGRNLSPLVQQALDVVRVIGNEAVHPGSLDLRDDHATAMQLFGLVNLIAETMISQPKHVLSLYSSLPPEKVAAIERRDGKPKPGA